jgi:hypothetical protein
VRECESIVPYLIRSRVLSEPALSVLGIYCATLTKVVAAIEAGMPAQANMLTALRLLANDFGITPAGQSRVTPSAPVRLRPNPFDKLKSLDAEP